METPHPAAVGLGSWLHEQSYMLTTKNKTSTFEMDLADAPPSQSIKALTIFILYLYLSRSVNRFLFLSTVHLTPFTPLLPKTIDGSLVFLLAGGGSSETLKQCRGFITSSRKHRCPFEISSSLASQQIASQRHRKQPTFIAWRSLRRLILVVEIPRSTGSAALRPTTSSAIPQTHCGS